MGNMNLDDVKGYFHALVQPNLEEFWLDYQSGKKWDRGNVSNVFRKMVNLCLTLNHHADKVSLKLKYTKTIDLVAEIKKHYPSEGDSVDAVRKFSNDVKHESKLEHFYTIKKIITSKNSLIEIKCPEWYYVDSSGNKVSICSSVVEAFWFWQNWLDNQRFLVK